MRIPSSINVNTLRTYEHILHSDSNGTIHGHNLKWDDAIPKSLQNICIEVIAVNWAENPILEEIVLPSDRNHLLEILSTEIPLSLAIPKINSYIYWERCYVEKWPGNLPHRVERGENPENIVKQNDSVTEIHRSNVNSRNNSAGSSLMTNSRSIDGNGKSDCPKNGEKTWKECFIEMHVKTYLENLKPENYDAEKLKELSDLCSPYVKVLKMQQMQSSRNSTGRIPLNSVLTGFQNLRELSLCFKQTYIGEDFSWNIVRTSQQDIKLLTKGLEKLRLNVLRVLNSDIDGEKAKMILKSSLKHEIKVLDFSNCKIGDEGMIVVSKYLLEVPVEEVILVNNKIGIKGVEALSYSLFQPQCKLIKLDLRLNQIYDKGCNFLTGVLEDNGKTLRSLLLPGCRLTNKVSFERLIYKNKTMEVLDISNNPVGEYVGQEILEAMKYNSTLRKIDLRMSMISSETEFSIQEMLMENRNNKRRVLPRSPFVQEGNDYKFENEDLLVEMMQVFDFDK